MMNRAKYALLAASLVLAGAALAETPDTRLAADDLPVVPASVMKKNVPTPIGATRSTQPTDVGLNEDSVLHMQAGVNQIIPVATGHPNRIVTPFSAPEVVSTSLSGMNEKGECGEICIKENVVYVATDKQHPVTMFITEKGSEAQALSLTMVPRRIPPREVFLRLDSGPGLGSTYANAKAEAWEQSQPYIDTVRAVFREAALGKVPQGYTLNRIPAGAKVPRCAQPGLRVDFAQGQYMMGHHLNVFVGVAQNITDRAIEFREALCGGWDVAAVSAWPRNVLEPGQKTEVYVAVKQRRGVAPTSRRPSLLERTP